MEKDERYKFVLKKSGNILLFGQISIRVNNPDLWPDYGISEMKTGGPWLSRLRRRSAKILVPAERGENSEFGLRIFRLLT